MQATGTVIRQREIGWAKGLALDKPKNNPIDYRSQGLKQVQNQRWAVGPRLVQKAGRLIQTNAGGFDPDLALKHGIGVIGHGLDGVPSEAISAVSTRIAGAD